MKENPCGRAQDLVGMKKDIGISRFPQLICVTDGSTDMTSYKCARTYINGQFTLKTAPLFLLSTYLFDPRSFVFTESGQSKSPLQDAD